MRQRLRGGAVVPLVWAGLLAIQTGLLFLFPARLISHVLNAWMVVTMALLGLALLPRPEGRDEVGSTRALPDASAATFVLAAGVAALVLGATLGPWLLLVGAGLALAGLAGVVREWRAAR